jgi:hypothetical protein
MAAFPDGLDRRRMASTTAGWYDQLHLHPSPGSAVVKKPPPRPVVRRLITALALAISAAAPGIAPAEEFAIHTFERQQLTDVYYSEGIAAGDLNRDGQADIVYGPYWFAGPGFKERHEIYPAVPQPREKYADHFFAWVHDFNGDGWNDVLAVGFPGTPAFVYENPGASGQARPWPRHQVLDQVANESPQFTNLVGDERPELVCTHDGFFGYARFDASRPLEGWTFHAISEKVAPIPFGHGLGVGDVNGDGRLDLLMKDGWFEQPRSLDTAARWAFHRAAFAKAGGAEMYAYDVDGDGDNDVITSLAAHDFGLAWHEQVKDGDAIAFRPHVILGEQPAQNPYGLVFSELHSVNLADIDGDGLKDIVTGKTYYSHHKQSPMWDAGAVVYWFRLVRTPAGVDWVPYRADDTAGIGRQLVVHDINGDGLPDLAAGGMKGAHVLMHRRAVVDEERWRAAQPTPTAQSRPDDPPKALRVFVAGHSFHMPVAQPLSQIAASAGASGPTLAGTQGIGGSSVTRHWELPDESDKARKAIKAGQVDVLTVSPVLDPLPDPAIAKFTALLLEHNPGGRVTVQASWYPMDGPATDRRTFKNADRDAADPASFRKTWGAVTDRVREQVVALNAEFARKTGRRVVALVPVGDAIIALRARVARGEVPGIARQSDLFRDDLGHGKPPIAVLTAYCHYAVIYGRNPIGLPAPEALRAAGLGENTDRVNQVLQEVAWQAVTAEPESGVKPPDGK